MMLSWIVGKQYLHFPNDYNILLLPFPFHAVCTSLTLSPQWGLEYVFSRLSLTNANNLCRICLTLISVSSVCLFIMLLSPHRNVVDKDAENAKEGCKSPIQWQTEKSQRTLNYINNCQKTLTFYFLVIHFLIGKRIQYGPPERRTQALYWFLLHSSTVSTNLRLF